MVATSTGLTKILNKVMKSGPSIIALDQVDSLVLSEVSSGWMIMFVIEDSKSEIFRVGHIDMIISLEETIGVQRPLWVGLLRIEVNGCDRVSRQSRADVGVVLLDVHQGHGSEYWRKKYCCSEG